ncbi:Ms4533A family Cys-rich leader peptide [Nocardia sp. GAS34]|uniref:Ms4533A family Cys-rich leader peptide n=1 Tax=unclassified Nocardia TaxID=2637762 RepID=UPI003D2163C1
MFPGAGADPGKLAADAVRSLCHVSPYCFCRRSRRFIPFCYSLPVSSSAVPRVRHELALIAVGCLVVADVYCR